MLHQLLALFLSLAALPAIVLGEDRFVQPGGSGPAGNYQDNPTYQLGEKIDVQWESSIEYMDLILWQDYPRANGNSFFFKKVKAQTRSTSFIWTANMDGFSTNVTAGEDVVMYWTIYKFGENRIVFSSHYFNVTLDGPETSTLSEATATASLSSVAPEGATPTASATTTADSSSTDSADSSTETTQAADADEGLSTGAVAGIAVGATIGGMLLLAGLGFLIWKRTRKEKPSEKPPGEPSAHQHAELSTPEQKQHELAGNPHISSPGGQPYARGPGGLHEAPWHGNT